MDYTTPVLFLGVLLATSFGGLAASRARADRMSQDWRLQYFGIGLGVAMAVTAAVEMLRAP